MEIFKERDYSRYIFSIGQLKEQISGIHSQKIKTQIQHLFGQQYYLKLTITPQKKY